MTETIKSRVVLGVDPGTTTGLALVRFNADRRPHFMECDQRPWSEACAKAERWLAQMGRMNRRDGYEAACACEKFTINAQTGQRGQSPAEDSLGMNGVIRRECEKVGVMLGKLEQASAAKNLVSDQILKAFDLYAVGMKHANDAMRHAILYAVKNRWMDPQLLSAALT